MTELIAKLPSPTPDTPPRGQTPPRRQAKGLAGGTTLHTTGSLLRAARPGQWPKNLLLLAAPAAAGVLTEPTVALHALTAAVAFTLGSAATYFLNDLRDIEADRRHPSKCRRPFASGRISTRLGYTMALVLAVAAVLLALSVGWLAAAGLCTYLLLTTAYSLQLKKFAVIDILAVAMGFVLRAGTGALATGVAVTSWFLLVTFFVALYIVTAKRLAELHSQATAAGVGPGAGTSTGAGTDALAVPAAGPAQPGSRATLLLYTNGWLEQTLTLALTSAVICYSLWAVQYPGTPVASLLIQASILPFIASLLRYGYVCSRGDGQRPEHLMFTDGFLAVVAVAWLAPTMTGIYMTVGL